MPLEATLRFLGNAVNVYYAGLDSDSLPFSEGKRLVRKTSCDHILYLKALAFVADHIVVPPSFYFFWTDVHRDHVVLGQLAELYHAGILISPIYMSMNLGTDFLEQKLARTSTRERALIQANRHLLIPFFRQMPVLHRDVRRQSGGYRELFAQELASLRIGAEARKAIERFADAPQYDEVLLSREHLQVFLYASLNTCKLTRREFRHCFYAANRSYYRQGAVTHDAIISLVGAERYSVLGPSAFCAPRGILIAYDPMVLLGILESIGIPRTVIRRLSADDINAIRKAPVFPVFRDAYYDFAVALQDLALQAQTRLVSRRGLSGLANNVQIQAISRILHEQKRYLKWQRWWNMGEMITFSAALGVAGFFVIPLVGAVLGAVPVLAYSLGLTPKLSDLVVSRLAEKELPFYIFTRELRAVTERLRTRQAY